MQFTVHCEDLVGSLQAFNEALGNYKENEKDWSSGSLSQDDLVWEIYST